ncbi:MAG: hypothetical protein JXA20_10125 [Spirochaetes bacterium]|nr:hypothetical protein [Spirochaetota bacterium]
MNKKTRNAALLAAAVLLSIAGLFVISWIVTSREEPARPAAVIVPAAVEEIKETVTIAPAPAGRARAVLKTNDDIRRRYGRVETVYLFDGRTYTGAVVATDGQEYSIVTVGGMKKVPMSMVKMRDIIR